ncbi:hypothetical protein [Streptomyces sp. NPDC051219]|uniref:hypothetical protein n=1 Tax=Streptomyces sp. NPDC051219 TaxID=3155283 RepID=UPI003412A0EC
MDLADPQQTHGYTYANNNPVSLTDPSGYRPDDCMSYNCELTSDGWQFGDSVNKGDADEKSKTYAQEDAWQVKTRTNRGCVSGSSRGDSTRSGTSRSSRSVTPWTGCATPTRRPAGRQPARRRPVPGTTTPRRAASISSGSS